MRRTVQRLYPRKAIVALWIACCLLTGLPFSAAQSLGQQLNGNSEAVSINPEFLKYLEEKSSGGWDADSKCCWVPLSIILPPPAAPLVSSRKAVALPSKFDLRSSTPIGVTPVKDQRECGACWAFAAMASLESHLRYKHGVTLDFSEAHLNEKHGFNSPVCRGGNWKMAAAYFARWSGPVAEADAPYPYFFRGLVSPADQAGLSPEMGGVLIPRLPAVPIWAAKAYRVQDVYFLPQAGTPLTPGDIATLKQALYDDGAVVVSFFSAGEFYNDTYHSYYCDANTGTNHSVAIVGWDDSYPAANFNSQAPGNGAFIVKNSVGKSWAEDGYFYMSYYDRSLKIGAQFHAEPAGKYTHVYQYDPYGWTYSAAVGPGQSTGWFSNIFMASPNATVIDAVSFYTPVADSTYSVLVYGNVTPDKPRSGKLVRTKSGTLAKPGYHTVRIAPAVVAGRCPFSVVVQLTTPGCTTPVAVQSSIEALAASSCSGQSFLSRDGVEWWGGGADYNVCLKAFATKRP
jgi:C1A family cysteine protease